MEIGRNLAGILLSALLVNPVSPVIAQQAGMWIVRFEGMKSDRGCIACARVDSAEGLMSRSHAPKRNFQAKIIDGKSIRTVAGLPFGSYAVSVYHDENGNGELDTGLFGIPGEDHGFANNARGSFGPSDYADAAFEFSRSGQELVIRIE